ncbi:MAG: O-antigen ligase family protein [Saprospiraceae bacterium]|nr:O-antigen ligase family protein [Saprospiraceae bacterium]
MNWSKGQILLIVFITMGIVFVSFYFELYVLLFIPLVFLLGSIIFFKPDLLFFCLAFLTPLSINPADAELGKLSLSLPTEPIAAVLVLLFFLLFFTTEKVDKKFLLHPISWLLYIYFAWLLVTSFTSVDKVVSIKFVIAKLWFIIPCYFLAAIYFKEPKNIYTYLYLFVFGLSLVAMFNIVHLATFGFEDKPSQWTMQPFFKDHTILGAILALVIPLSFGLIRLDRGNKFRQISLFGFTLILLTCLVVTFSRAAWVSIIPALLLFLILFFKLRFKYVLMLVGFGLFYLFSNLDVILMDLEHNKVAGSDDVIENAESISNISTDPSNLERINRWACAIEMWKDKPYFGWGPGTYMFEYAPFQLRGNYTAISTNFGDVGNAHSEYLGPLAETGVLGLLIFAALFVMVFVFGFRAYFRSTIKAEKILLSTVMCALITYFVHGFLNNFLDTDKASNIFWPLIAIIVVMDLKLAKTK